MNQHHTAKQQAHSPQQARLSWSFTRLCWSAIRPRERESVSGAGAMLVGRREAGRSQQLDKNAGEPPLTGRAGSSLTKMQSLEVKLMNEAERGSSDLKRMRLKAEPSPSRAVVLDLSIRGGCCPGLAPTGARARGWLDCPFRTRNSPNEARHAPTTCAPSSLQTVKPDHSQPNKRRPLLCDGF